MPRIRICLLAALLLWLTPLSAGAISFISSAADPALASSALITLDSEPDGLSFTSHTTLGGELTFSTTNGTLLLSSTWTASFGTTGVSLQTPANGPTNDITIAFNAPVSAFGFVVNALDIDWSMQAFDTSGNAIGGAFTIADQSPPFTGNARRGYAGLATGGADPLIGSIRITATGTDWAIIDNFSLVVAEPSTFVMLTIGLLGLAQIGRPRAA
jgi:hypothetical protein